MIQITPAIALDENEIQEEFIRSSGAGGQNVNKVSTAVQLRFDVAASASLPSDIKERLMQLAGNRMTQEGVLVIKAQTSRTQDRNRQDAVERLVALIAQAAHKPIVRRPTKPTKGSQRRRLESKRLHSQTKRARRARPDSAD
jgi:ribosome-associated protein